MKCRDCKYCYSNNTMHDLYICVNGNAENFGQFTGLLCEDDCPDGEEEFIYPEAHDEPFDEILGEASEEDYKNIQNLIKCGSQTIHTSGLFGKSMTIADGIKNE